MKFHCSLSVLARRQKEKVVRESSHLNCELAVGGRNEQRHWYCRMTVQGLRSSEHILGICLTPTATKLPPDEKVLPQLPTFLSNKDPSL